MHVSAFQRAALLLLDGLAGLLAEVAPELLALRLLDALLEGLELAGLLTSHGLLISSRHKLALLQVARHSQRHGMLLQRMLTLDGLLARRQVQRAMTATLSEISHATIAGTERVL